MKYLALFFCLMISARLHAQQAKAYENVHYIANINKLHFKLNYADGYLAASQIKLIQPGQKTQVFTPESGTPEPNGSLILQAGANAGIMLSGINEEMPAPKTIKATYRAKGVVLQLLFHKTQ